MAAETRLGRALRWLPVLGALALVLLIGARVLAVKYPWLDWAARDKVLQIAEETTLRLRAHPVYDVGDEGVSLSAKGWWHELYEHEGSERRVMSYECADYSEPIVERGRDLLALTLNPGCDRTQLFVRTASGRWQRFWFGEGHYASYPGWSERPRPPAWPASEVASVNLASGQIVVTRRSGDFRQRITFALSEDGERLVVAEAHLE